MQVFGSSPTCDMNEKFWDILAFCHQVSLLMVSEIRKRASNQSTEAASCAIAKFLEIENCEESSNGWMLLSTLNLLASGDSTLVQVNQYLLKIFLVKNSYQISVNEKVSIRQLQSFSCFCRLCLKCLFPLLQSNACIYFLICLNYPRRRQTARIRAVILLLEKGAFFYKKYSYK